MKSFFKKIWHVGSIVVPAAAAAFGISTDPLSLANVALGALGKRLPNKIFNDRYIPIANIALGAGIALAQGMTVEQAAAEGVKRMLIAAGAHASVKTPVQAATGHSI